MRFSSLSLAAAVLSVAAVAAQATDRLFTYSYEPETMPEKGFEFEQWVTLGTQRNHAVGQDNYERWALREEFEYGVSDRYTVSFYLNTGAESFRDPAGVNSSKFDFQGVAIENKYLVLNPTEHAVGLALYLEPAFSGDTAEVEQKLILGQRHGSWKWALNLTHSIEWEDQLHSMEGEFEATAGLAYEFNPRWALGLELRSVQALPDYRRWESSALFAGPVLSYRQEKWWAALTILPQVWGKNYDGNPDQNAALDLAHHERVEVRLILGLQF